MKISEQDAVLDALLAERAVLLGYLNALTAAGSRALRGELLRLFQGALEGYARLRERREDDGLAEAKKAKKALEKLLEG